MDDVTGSVTATLSDNEDDLPENTGATNTNEDVVSPGPGSSNQIKDQLKHSEDLGLVGEGAPVRPRVAGGGGGGEREGQELPGYHEDSLWRSPLMTIWTLLMRGVRSLIMRKVIIVMILRTSLKIWMMLEVQLKEC